MNPSATRKIRIAGKIETAGLLEDPLHPPPDFPLPLPYFSDW